MASFLLVLAGPTGVSTWTWDASELRRDDLDPGTHMMTSRGVDADDEKTARYAPRFAEADWRAVSRASRRPTTGPRSSSGTSSRPTPTPPCSGS